MTKRPKSLPFRNRLRLAKNIATFQLARLAGKQPVFVYQMGKVGSSALTQLIDRMPGYTSIQVHRLMPGRTAEIRARFDAGEHYYRDMRFEEWVYRYITGFNRPTKIVTVVREPMAHSYSAFFQNLPRSTRGAVMAAAPKEMDGLRKHFIEWDDLGAGLIWLDEELSAIAGCDLLNQPFDKERGWECIDHQRFSILLLKAEIHNDLKREAIGRFLGCDPGAVKQTNSASDKSYATAYKAFIDEVKLPSDIAREWANHRYTRQFYTESEIAEALDKFAERGGTGG